MAPTLTRDIVKQYNVTDSGSIPDSLFKRDVPDFIPIVKRVDTVLARMVGTGPAKNLLAWEYGESDLAPVTDTITTALADDTGTAVEVANGTRFQKFDLFKIDDEVLWVSALSGNDLTATRGWGTSTGASHLDNAVVQILGPAVPEGVDAPESPVAKGETFVTYPQILEYTWRHSHRGRKTPNYEVETDGFKHEMTKKMKEAAIDLDLLMLYGVKNKGNGDGVPSSMGGLLEATTTNVTDLNGDPWTLYDLMTGLEPAYNDVGADSMGRTLMGNIFWAGVFNSWFQASRRTSGSDKTLDITWDSVQTEYGPIKFVVNYRMKKEDGVIAWNEKDAKRHAYEGGNWSTGLYSTQGWYDKGFLRGDFGVIWQADRRRTRFIDMSVTPTDYPNLHVAA